MSGVFKYGKEERLCDKRIIDRLFSHGDKLQSCFPLRVVCLLTTRDYLSGPAIFISIPKRKLKFAVDRNRMKRIIRELYRTMSPPLRQALSDNNKGMAVGFVFIDNKVWSFSELQPKIKLITYKLLDLARDKSMTISESAAQTDNKSL